MIKRVCTGCGKTIGYKPGMHGVSHGYCPECESRILREYADLKAAIDAPDDSEQAKNLREYVEANR